MSSPGKPDVQEKFYKSKHRPYDFDDSPFTQREKCRMHAIPRLSLAKPTPLFPPAMAYILKRKITVAINHLLLTPLQLKCGQLNNLLLLFALSGR